MATLARISMTPVKGTALVHPDSIHVTPAGIPANRRFYLVDDGGELFSAYDHGPLVSIVSTYEMEEDRLRLSFPDATEVEGTPEATGVALTTNFHGRPVRARIVHGPWAEAVSSFVGQPLRLARVERDGEATDVEPLTLVSTASIADLGSRGGHEGPLDGRRFRIDLEVAGTRPYQEDSWSGHRLTVGDALLEVLGQIPRCRVTAQDPVTGAHDWNTLGHIARFRPRIDGDGGLPFGMYARVQRPGWVRVGDEVVLAG